MINCSNMKYLMKQRKLPCIHNGSGSSHECVRTSLLTTDPDLGLFWVFRSSSHWSLNDFVPEWNYEEQWHRFKQNRLYCSIIHHLQRQDLRGSIASVALRYLQAICALAQKITREQWQSAKQLRMLHSWRCWCWSQHTPNAPETSLLFPPLFHLIQERPCIRNEHGIPENHESHPHHCKKKVLFAHVAIYRLYHLISFKFI